MAPFGLKLEDTTHESMFEVFHPLGNNLQRSTSSLRTQLDSYSKQLKASIYYYRDDGECMSREIVGAENSYRVAEVGDVVVWVRQVDNFNQPLSPDDKIRKVLSESGYHSKFEYESLKDAVSGWFPRKSDLSCLQSEGTSNVEKLRDLAITTGVGFCVVAGDGDQTLIRSDDGIFPVCMIWLGILSTGRFLVTREARH